jgi:hypothetical protein
LAKKYLSSLEAYNLARHTTTYGGPNSAYIRDVKSALSGIRSAAIREGGLANGGRVFGAGGPVDDKIPAMLSNGEYVMSAGAVNQYGPGFMDAINAGKFARGGIAKFARGTTSNVAARQTSQQRMNAYLGGNQEVIEETIIRIMNFGNTLELLKDKIIQVAPAIGQIPMKVETSLTSLKTVTTETSAMLQGAAKTAGTQVAEGFSKAAGAARSFAGSVIDSAKSVAMAGREILGSAAGSAIGCGGSLMGKIKSGLQPGGGIRKAFGFSFGAMMAGQALGMGAQSLAGKVGGAGGAALGGAGTGAQLGSMFGWGGMLAGAVIGGAIGYFSKRAKEAAEAMRQNANMLKTSLSTSASEAGILGVQLTSFKLSVLGTGDAAKKAQTEIDNLASSLKQVADSDPKIKDTLTKLTKMVKSGDTAGVEKFLIQKLNTTYLATQDLGKSKELIAAYAQLTGANVPTTMPATAEQQAAVVTSKTVSSFIAGLMQSGIDKYDTDKSGELSIATGL